MTTALHSGTPDGTGTMQTAGRTLASSPRNNPGAGCGAHGAAGDERVNTPIAYSP